MLISNVVIIDRHPVDALGIKSFLHGTDFFVVQQFDAVDRALEYIVDHQVDIVLSEIDLTDALELQTWLAQKSSPAKVVFFSANRNPVMLNQARITNCAGAINKNLGRENILEALRSVSDTGSCWTRASSRQIVGALTAVRVDIGTEASLTKREYDVLQLVALGKTNQQIAEDLGISYETVKEHVQNTLRKLHVNDRTQAAIWMTRQLQQPERS